MSETKKLTYGEAANGAIRRALSEDSRVLVYGEDVGKPGGVFGVTRGLHREFGDRVFDTPISEAAILGSAVGASLFGIRPIVEIMWADFSLVALDQLVNQASNVRYVSRGEVSAPIVVRTQQGNAPGACAQHSQCLEALFLHIPGLRVVMPRTAQDAYDALLSAVACPDPVIVIENRTLYAGEKQDVVVDQAPQPPGWAHRRRPGSDVTLVVWGALTQAALDAATVLDAEGISVEVIETPWLNPFPSPFVLASVSRTRRLIVAHEAVKTGGFAAEVITTGRRVRSRSGLRSDSRDGCGQPHSGSTHPCPGRASGHGKNCGRRSRQLQRSERTTIHATCRGCFRGSPGLGLGEVGMLCGIWHFSFHVSDIERSVSFYRALGMELVLRQDQSNAYTSRLVGYEGAALRVAQMALPGGGGSVTVSTHVLELVEYVEPRQPRQPLERCMPGTGHMAFAVDDIMGEYVRLTGLGVSFVSPPNAITAGVNAGGLACYFLDPDDITLELVQPPVRTLAD